VANMIPFIKVFYHIIILGNCD